MEKALVSVRVWFAEGSAPPATHFRSLGVMALLLIFGLSTLAVALASYFEWALNDVFLSTLPLFGASALALIPSVYVATIAFFAWRRLHGYTWADVPYVQTDWY